MNAFKIISGGDSQRAQDYKKSILLISRPMYVWKITCISPYVWLMNCRFHLSRSSASSFSSDYLLLFHKSLRSCVLVATPFISVICPALASWGRQFLLWIWSIQFGFLRRILFRNVLFSPISSRTCSFVTFFDHFIFSILLQQHISKLSKYFHSKFLSVKVSEPYQAMLQTFEL